MRCFDLFRHSILRRFCSRGGVGVRRSHITIRNERTRTLSSSSSSSSTNHYLTRTSMMSTVTTTTSSSSNVGKCMIHNESSSRDKVRDNNSSSSSNDDLERKIASKLTDLVFVPNFKYSKEYVEYPRHIAKSILNVNKVQNEMLRMMSRRGHWTRSSEKQLPFMLERLGQILIALRGDKVDMNQVQNGMESAATRVVQRLAESSNDVETYERTIKCLSRNSYVRPQFLLSVFEYFAVESDLVTNLTFDIALLVASRLDLLSTQPIQKYPMQTVLTQFSEISFSSKSYTSRILRTHDQIRISSTKRRVTFHFPNRFLDRMTLDAVQFRTLVQFFATKPLPDKRVRENRSQFIIKMLRHVRRNPEKLSKELDMLTTLLLKHYAMGRRRLGNTKVIDALIHTRADLSHFSQINQIVTMCPQILDRSAAQWIESGSHLPSNLLLSFAIQKNWHSVEMMVGVFESGLGELRPTEHICERLKDLHRKASISDKKKLEGILERILRRGMRAS